MTAAVAVTLVGCSKEESKAATAPAQSADAQPVASTAPSASEGLPSESDASGANTSTSASTSTAGTTPVDCPKGSSGEGTFSKPCEGKGGARMMDVAWTGKTDEKGPHFRVANRSQSVVLYGKLAVYFYDKTGKQMEVKNPASAKPNPFLTCGGNIFGGLLKGGEKAVLTFSCVKKEQVPDGATAIEAEMQMVGFADSSGNKSSSYWRNTDLTPDQRKKGGVH